MFTTTKTERTCSNHPDAAAVSYCRACKKFMCAKCEGLHRELLGKGHEGSAVPASSADNDSDCPCSGKCPIHTEYPLDTFCRDCKGTLIFFLPHSTSLHLHVISSFYFCFSFSSSLLCEVQVGRKSQGTQHYPYQ